MGIIREISASCKVITPSWTLRVTSRFYTTIILFSEEIVKDFVEVAQFVRRYAPTPLKWCRLGGCFHPRPSQFNKQSLGSTY